MLSNTDEFAFSLTPIKDHPIKTDKKKAYGLFMEEQYKLIKIAHPFLSDQQIKVKARDKWNKIMEPLLMSEQGGRKGQVSGYRTRQSTGSLQSSSTRKQTSAIKKDETRPRRRHSVFVPLDVSLTDDKPKIGKGIIKKKRSKGSENNLHVTFSSQAEVFNRTVSEASIDSSKISPSNGIRTYSLKRRRKLKSELNASLDQHLNPNCSWSYKSMSIPKRVNSPKEKYKPEYKVLTKQKINVQKRFEDNQKPLNDKSSVMDAKTSTIPFVEGDHSSSVTKQASSNSLNYDSDLSDEGKFSSSDSLFKNMNFASEDSLDQKKNRKKSVRRKGYKKRRASSKATTKRSTPAPKEINKASSSSSDNEEWNVLQTRYSPEVVDPHKKENAVPDKLDDVINCSFSSDSIIPPSYNRNEQKSDETKSEEKDQDRVVENQKKGSSQKIHKDESESEYYEDKLLGDNNAFRVLSFNKELGKLYKDSFRLNEVNKLNNSLGSSSDSPRQKLNSFSKKHRQRSKLNISPLHSRVLMKKILAIASSSESMDYDFTEEPSKTECEPGNTSISSSITGDLTKDLLAEGSKSKNVLEDERSMPEIKNKSSDDNVSVIFDTPRSVEDEITENETVSPDQSISPCCPSSQSDHLEEQLHSDSKSKYNLRTRKESHTNRFCSLFHALEKSKTGSQELKRSENFHLESNDEDSDFKSPVPSRTKGKCKKSEKAASKKESSSKKKQSKSSNARLSKSNCDDRDQSGLLDNLFSKLVNEKKSKLQKMKTTESSRSCHKNKMKSPETVAITDSQRKTTSPIIIKLSPNISESMEKSENRVKSSNHEITYDLGKNAGLHEIESDEANEDGIGESGAVREMKNLAPSLRNDKCTKKHCQKPRRHSGNCETSKSTSARLSQESNGCFLSQKFQSQFSKALKRRRNYESFSDTSSDFSEDSGSNPLKGRKHAGLPLSEVLTSTGGSSAEKRKFQKEKWQTRKGSGGSKGNKKLVNSNKNSSLMGVADLQPESAVVSAPSADLVSKIVGLMHTYAYIPPRAKEIKKLTKNLDGQGDDESHSATQSECSSTTSEFKYEQAFSYRTITTSEGKAAEEKLFVQLQTGGKNDILGKSCISGFAYSQLRTTEDNAKNSLNMGAPVLREHNKLSWSEAKPVDYYSNLYGMIEKQGGAESSDGNRIQKQNLKSLQYQTEKKDNELSAITAISMPNFGTEIEKNSLCLTKSNAYVGVSFDLSKSGSASESEVHMVKSPSSSASSCSFDTELVEDDDYMDLLSPETAPFSDSVDKLQTESNLYEEDISDISPVKSLDKSYEDDAIKNAKENSSNSKSKIVPRSKPKKTEASNKNAGALKQQTTTQKYVNKVSVLKPDDKKVNKPSEICGFENEASKTGIVQHSLPKAVRRTKNEVKPSTTKIPSDNYGFSPICKAKRTEGGKDASKISLGKFIHENGLSKVIPKLSKPAMGKSFGDSGDRIAIGKSESESREDNYSEESCKENSSNAHSKEVSSRNVTEKRRSLSPFSAMRQGVSEKKKSMLMAHSDKELICLSGSSDEEQDEKKKGSDLHDFLSELFDSP